MRLSSLESKPFWKDKGAWLIIQLAAWLVQKLANPIQERKACPHSIQIESTFISHLNWGMRSMWSILSVHLIMSTLPTEFIPTMNEVHYWHTINSAPLRHKLSHVGVVVALVSLCRNHADHLATNCSTVQVAISISVMRWKFRLLIIMSWPRLIHFIPPTVHVFDLCPIHFKVLVQTGLYAMIQGSCCWL